MKLPVLILPTAQLQHLQQLKLICVPWEPAQLTAGQPSSAMQPVSQATLASLTAMTHLSLCGSSVRLAGLEALTALKALIIATSSSLDAFASDDEAAAAGPSNSWDRAGALLVAELPKLQALTHLGIYSEYGSEEVIAEVRTLQHLERLEFTLQVEALQMEAPTITLPAQLAVPQSLSGLAFCFVGDQTDVDGIAPRGFCNMPQVTGLRGLRLHNVAALDATVLASMTRLLDVEFENVHLTSTCTQPLLGFSKLTALQELTLSDTDRLTPAEAAALTSSRHLACLDLQGLVSLHDSLQLAHYQAMFPKGRQLQQLGELLVGTALVASTDSIGWPARQVLPTPPFFGPGSAIIGRHAER